MSLTLTLRSTSHKHNVVYGPNGDEWFSIETKGEHTFRPNPTLIYRISPKGKELIATMDFRCFGSDTIKFASEETPRVTNAMFRRSRMGT